MTTEPDTSSSDGGSGSALGRGLAHRSRSQIVLARRRPAARLIGAVARSSIGFGLAVGRSRSIRPVVRRTDLNSATLRPPPGFWLDRSDDEPAPDVGDLTPTSPQRSSPTTSRPDTSRSTRRAAATRSSRPRTAMRSTARRRIARIETSPIAAEPAAATWTDQVIQRAGVGYVRPTSQTFTPAPARDEGFVPSNDAKLDDLRLLVAARNAAGGGRSDARDAAATPPRDRTVARRSTTSGASAAAAPVGSGSSASVRGDTAAGRSTGPGRLARSVIPESAVEGQALTSTKAAGGRARASAASATTAIPSTPGRGGAPRQRARRSTPESRMNDLREALLSKGLLPTSDGDGDRGDAGPATSSDAGRGTPTSGRGTGDAHPSPAPQGRSPAGRGPSADSPTVQRAPRSDRQVTADDPRAGGSGRGPSGRATGDARPGTAGSPVGTGDPTVDRRRPTGGGVPPTDPSSSGGVLQRRTAAAGAAPAHAPATGDGESRGDARSGAVVTASPATQASDLDVVRPAAGVGLLDADDPVLDDRTASRPDASPITVARRIGTPDPTLRRSPATPDPTPEVSNAARAGAPATGAARGAAPPTGSGAAVGEDARLPLEVQRATIGLPALGGVEGELRRRLTLPRAMSSTHRPTGALVSVPSAAGTRIVRRAVTRSVAPGDTVGATPLRLVGAAPVTASPTSPDGLRQAGAMRGSLATVMPSADDGAPVVRRWLDAPVAAEPLPTGEVAPAFGGAAGRKRPTTASDAGDVARAINRVSSEVEPAPTTFAGEATAQPADAPRRSAHQRPSTVAAGPGALLQAIRRPGPEPTSSRSAGLLPHDPVARRSPSGSTTSRTAGPVDEPVARRSPSDSTSSRPADSRTDEPVNRRPGPESMSRRSADSLPDEPVGRRPGPESTSSHPADSLPDEPVGRRPGPESTSQRSAGVIRRSADREPGPAAPGRSSPGGSQPPSTAERSGAARPAARTAAGAPATRDSSTPGNEHSDVAEAAPLAQRFMTELATTIQRRPAPLPVAFQPMAEAIAGERHSRNIMISTDTASRRALRRAGKVAATTNNVIHLAQEPTPGERVNEIIAHELTHVANPSPVARFFDDVDDSPEERQAERVAKVMASSPIAPSASTLAPSGRAAPSDVVRRTPAPGASRTPSGGATSPRPSTGSGPGAVSAAALAASISSTSESSVQRLAMGSHRAASSAPASASASAGDPGGEKISWKGAAPQNAPLGVQLRTSSEAREWFVEQLEKNLDGLLHAIEDRMIVEYERRGGRLWEGL